MPAAEPPARIGKYAASLKNPHPANSERQPRNAAWHDAQEAAPVGLINRTAAVKKRVRRKR